MQMASKAALLLIAGLTVTIPSAGTATGIETEQTEARGGHAATQLTGTVVFADGTPAGGAVVEATQDCYQIGDSIEIRSVTSDADGTFSLSAFDPKCHRYRFSASKVEEYWLPTDGISSPAFGADYPSERIVAEFSSSRPPKPVRIVLNRLGGKVAIRVRDVLTGRFIYADLSYQREPAKLYKIQWGLMPTGLDGSAVVHLFAPGDYSVQVGTFKCGSEEYLAANGPRITLNVKPATESHEVIDIDVRNIKVQTTERGKPHIVSAPTTCNP
jgi:hypothetical protein